jgi:hypothetical protein
MFTWSLLYGKLYETLIKRGISVVLYQMAALVFSNFSSVRL